MEQKDLQELQTSKLGFKELFPKIIKKLIFPNHKKISYRINRYYCFILVNTEEGTDKGLIVRSLGNNSFLV